MEGPRKAHPETFLWAKNHRRPAVQNSSAYGAPKLDQAAMLYVAMYPRSIFALRQCLAPLL